MANPKKLQVLGKFGSGLKTVNGIGPDESGNVAVDIPEGFSGSWNDLSEKPFGEIEVELLATLYLTKPGPSEYTFTYETNFSDNRIHKLLSNGQKYCLVTDDKVYVSKFVYESQYDDICKLVGVDGNVDFPLIDFNTSTWEDPCGWTMATLKVYRYDEYGRVKTLDETYIPDTIARVEDIPTVVQSDLTVNNPDDPAYVKGRTHWVGDLVETVLVDNLTKSQYEDENYENPQCAFVVGDTYNVVWNGTLYENLVCIDDGEFRVIMSGDDYPAYIDDNGGNDLFIGWNDEDADWTVSIVHIAHEIHHIDKKFLPPDMTIAWDNISNRPGGYYEEIDHALLLHVDAEFSSDDTGMHDINEYAPKHLLTIGETYYPVIDGEELPAVVAKEYASQYQTYIVIGNPSLHNSSQENSGEDYLLLVNPETGDVWGLFIKNAVTNGVKTFDLYGKGEAPVLFSDEFIPNTIARTSDIPTGLPEVTTDNDGSFLRVVEGVWTVTTLTDVSTEGA